MSEQFNWDAISMKIGATADPAAGADWANITVPAGKKWKYYGFFTSSVLAAVAANRYVTQAILGDGTHTTAYFASKTAGTSGQTVYWSFTNGIAAEIDLFTAASLYIEPFAACELAAGTVIQTALINKNGGDNSTVLYYMYKEAPA